MISLKWRIALIIFVFVLACSGLSIFKNRQLNFMGGMAEEYFGMGINLYYYGKLSPTLTGARVFRPPGYPVFIASILRIWGGMPEEAETFFKPGVFQHERQAAYRAVWLAQSLLLSLTAVILFLLLSNYIRLSNAAVLATLFGCNPYLLILAGLLHYDIFHIFLTVVSVYSLSSVLDSRSKEAHIKMVVSGAFWGFTTLIRPVTLILPLFALPVFWIQFGRSWPLLLRSFILFILGMSLVIIPNTYHNYTLTGRIIPVNAQSGISVWGATVKKLSRDPNHYRWWELWYPEGMQIYRKVTGSGQYSYSRYVNNILELEDEFRSAAVKNLRRKPYVYVNNFLVDFLTFNLDINSVYIKLFQAIQNPDVNIDKKWLKVGDPQDFYSSSQANAFKYYIYLLTVFGFLGICLALKQKGKSILVAGLVYLCFCLAHALTYMDLMYYYIKVPFLYIFSGYFINTVDRDMIRIPLVDRQISPAAILNGVMIVFGIWLTIAIILV
ncbi:MAG: hypothetical protein JSU83_12675 [Deltaproteobacteria bacterium]|nr:MAG: hypothetical protein JSU83_12675 [Deltaproteobacteria bacterium]